MQKFVAKHAVTTTGTLSCFGRLLFTGICAPYRLCALRGHQPSASP
jgi:hypothetical protein